MMNEMRNKAQEKKSKILKAMPKKAQEEIVGFSMIIVIVAVVIIIFLSFSSNDSQKDTVESYEVESYLQSLLQKTSECRSPDNLRYYTIKELMFKCYNEESCLDGQKTCNVFIKETEKITNQSWNLGVGSPIKGYLLNLTVDGKELKAIGYGNQTRISKGSFQELARDGKMFGLEFNAYY